MKLIKKGVTTLVDLDDTDIDTATAYDILQYINGKWKNQQNLTMLGTGNIYLKGGQKIYFDA